jgi:hypothetical protein
MVVKCLGKYAVAAALALAGALAGSAPASAQVVWGGGVAVSPYDGYYDYAPGVVVTVPGPFEVAPYAYEPPEIYLSYPWWRPKECRFEIDGC